MSPRINYSPVLSYDNIEQPTPADSSFLLPRSEAESSATLSTLPGPAEENSKYGTFHTAPSDLQPSTSPTQAATPAPSTPEDPEVWNNFFKIFMPLYPFLISSLKMMRMIKNIHGQKR